jgi:hypothetical protein
VQDGCFCWELEAPALMTFLDDVVLKPERATRTTTDVVQRLKIVTAKQT